MQDIKYIRFEEARPEQVRAMLKDRPVAYVPLGALEWHGEHNPLGVDGLKAHAISLAAAGRTGGVVFPPVFWGAFGTMPFPFTFHHSRRRWKRLVREVVDQLGGMGFKLVVMISGHYPPAQVRLLRRLARKVNKKGEFFLLAAPEPAFALDLKYYGDHAGMWETSFMLAIRPDLVRLEAMPRGLSVIARKNLGVLGQDPVEKASAEKGKAALEHIAAGIEKIVERTLAERDDRAIEECYENYARAFKLSPRLLRVAGEALDVHSVFELIRYLMPYRRRRTKKPFENRAESSGFSGLPNGD